MFVFKCGLILRKVSSKLVSTQGIEINYFAALFEMKNKYSRSIKMNNLYFDERSESDMRTVFTKAVGQEIYRIRRS